MTYFVAPIRTELREAWNSPCLSPERTAYAVATAERHQDPR